MNVQRNIGLDHGGYVVVFSLMISFLLFMVGCTKSQTKSMNATTIDSGRMLDQADGSIAPDGGLLGDMEALAEGDQSLNRDHSLSDNAIEDMNVSSDGDQSANRDQSVADNASDAMVEPDAVETDMSTGTNPSEVSGQCAQSRDCLAGNENAGCNRLIPGGSCFGCFDDEDCPGPAECNLGYGTCITPCDDDTSCPPGLRCTVAGRCGAERCESGRCPDPRFGCSASGQCERSSCTDDAACPVGTVCIDQLCVLSSWRQRDADEP